MNHLLLYFDLFSAIFIFILGYYVFLKDSKRNLNRVFFLLSLAATFWAISSLGFRINEIPIGITEKELFKMITKEKIKVYNILNEIGWFGIAFLPSIFLHLNLIITKKKKFLEKYFLLPYFISLVFFLITVYDALKGIGEKVYPYFYGSFTLFFSFCLLISFIFLLKEYFVLKSPLEKRKLVYFLIGTLIPGIFGSILDIFFPFFKYGQYVGSTYSLYIYVLGLLFVAMGVFRYSLFIDYREMLEAIFKKLAEIVIFADKEDLILLTNDITLSKLNFDEGEIKEKKISDILGKRDWFEIKEKLKEKKVLFDQVVFLKKKDGNEIPFSISISEIKGGFILVGKDIGEIFEYPKRLREEIKKRTEELEEIKSSLEIRVEARKKELEELTSLLEKKVKEKEEELKKRINELEKFKRFAEGRELRLEELKREYERLKKTCLKE